MRIVIFGLSITSSWGNGHATTYRGLVRELSQRGHQVLFLERDVPWYAAHRDLARPPYGRTELYASIPELEKRFATEVARADLCMVGSYVPEGVEVGEWVLKKARGITAFYDIDTPVTLGKLARGDEEYLSRALVRRYDLYLSFTGGPTLRRLERELGAKVARALYCSFDPHCYYPEPRPPRWDLGYVGTYSACRQIPLDRLMLEPARRWKSARMVVAGPQYPPDIRWPPNVERIDHLPPPEHRAFYCAQRFTLNVTRADMIEAGYSPSVRLFEAAACGTPIISDAWPGLDTLFEPGREILVSRSSEETLSYLRELPERERLAIAQRGRARVLSEHTAGHRAVQLESYVAEVAGRRATGRTRRTVGLTAR